ncbi:MAG TPA: hypothetical protein VG328_16455 [Stellaceae bacterium]|jgi:TPR repeat protein|nr:hypothetical protein [Stellaceae bacterium]
MIRNIPLLAVDGIDPWEKVQIDPVTWRLAEHAAAAAGLAVEEWLERAIRRACPSAFRSAAVTIPTTPVVAPTFAAPPAPVAPSPAAVQRAPTIAERLAQQRIGETEKEDDGPSFLEDGQAPDERDWRDEDDSVPRMFDEHDADEPAAKPGKKKFKLWASRDEYDVEAADAAPGQPAMAKAHPLPPSQKSSKRLAIIGVAIALAVTAGAVTAQYLIPGRSHVPSAPSNDFSNSTRSFSAPTPNNPPPLPSLANGGDSGASSSPSLPSIPSPLSPPPASALSLPDLPPPVPSPSSTSSDLSTPQTNLPPVPDLPSPPSSAPSNDTASTSLTALPAPPSVPEASAAPPLSPGSVASAPPTASTKSDTSAPVSSVGPAPIANDKAAPAPTMSEATQSVPTKVASAVIPPPRATKEDRATKDDIAPTDPKALAPWLDQRAKTGDAIAQYRLGVLYALGQGVQQDYQHAASLFKTSAEGGVAEAQYNIAVMYGEGLGTGRDPVQAVQWYQKAAAQGNANAAFNLGVAYSNGVGVQHSMNQAAQWFRRAAASGIINAQFNLGLLYERGDGVPVSQVEAYAWYSAAATDGDSGAAQRRDRLAASLSPSTLKEAQARAQQVAATIKNTSNAPPGGLATNAATPASASK